MCKGIKFFTRLIIANCLPDYEARKSVVILNISEKNELQIEPRVRLLDALRESANLTGTKKGCYQSG